jgi:hypothetical protein
MQCRYIVFTHRQRSCQGEKWKKVGTSRYDVRAACRAAQSAPPVCKLWFFVPPAPQSRAVTSQREIPPGKQKTQIAKTFCKTL